jgi:hypothetical protein
MTRTLGSSSYNLTCHEHGVHISTNKFGGNEIERRGAIGGRYNQIYQSDGLLEISKEI